MAGLFLFDSIQAWLRRRKRDAVLRLAQAWPITQGEVNHWEILAADKEITTSATPYQIEAGYHFTLNGEYFGGYFRSSALVHHEAETKATGNPAVNIRYNPANPDSNVVLAQDNPDNLPFRVFAGSSSS
jgi:hypothetical protein